MIYLKIIYYVISKKLYKYFNIYVRILDCNKLIKDNFIFLKLKT